MDPIAISALVLSCLSLIASTITPIITASALLINRIKKSSCCGFSSIETEEKKP